jgi:hypothetical protein
MLHCIKWCSTRCTFSNRASSHVQDFADLGPVRISERTAHSPDLGKLSERNTGQRGRGQGVTYQGPAGEPLQPGQAVRGPGQPLLHDGRQPAGLLRQPLLGAHLPVADRRQGVAGHTLADAGFGTDDLMADGERSGATRRARGSPRFAGPGRSGARCRA